MTAYSFDLIPETFRRRQKLVRIAKRSTLAVAALLFAAAAAAGYLHLDSQGLLQQLAELEQEKRNSQRQQEKAESLNAKLAALQKREKLLLGLRSGIPVNAVMTAVEVALPANRVWLKQWQFIRSGIATEQQPDPKPPSYFIRIESPEPLSEWQALTHMTLDGQASDHQALSDFTKALLRQPGVSDVTVQRTSTRGRQSTDQPHIDFAVDVLIKTSVQAND